MLENVNIIAGIVLLLWLALLLNYLRLSRQAAEIQDDVSELELLIGEDPEDD